MDYQRRAEIENQYCKNLEKLSKSVSCRKFRKVFGNLTPTALSMSDGASPAKVTYNAFATLVNESEKQARSRGLMSEKMEEELSKTIKDFNKDKSITSKKLIEFGIMYQKEFIEAYDDLDKAKQSYDKLAKETESSKKKYEDMVSKPKTTFGALKVLVTGKDEEERKRKWKTNSRKLTDARNDYLLALEAINPLQSIYYGQDFPKLMERLDGSYYSTMSNLFTKYTNMEETISSGLAFSIELINSKIPHITRERDVTEFKQDYQNIFEIPSQFSFDRYSSDDRSALTVDEVTKVLLGQKLGLLILKNEETSAALSTKEKELEAIQKMTSVYSTTPSFGDASSTFNQQQDLEMEVRVLTFKLARIQAKIKLLKDNGVDPIFPEVPDGKGGPILSLGSSQSKSKAIAMYDYASQAQGELSIQEGDELTVLQSSDSDDKDWIQVKNNKTGESGLVPANYVNLVSIINLDSRQSSQVQMDPTSTVQYVKAVYDYQATEDGEITFQAGDKIEVLSADPEEEWWEGKVSRTGQVGSFQILFTQGWEAIQSSKSRPPSSHLKSTRTKKASSQPSQKALAKVLYDYTASAPGELSLVEGETITITSKSNSSWWEGEGSKGKGEFPSNYVEILPYDSSSTATAPKPSLAPRPISTTSILVRALYDYEATSPGELSLREGDEIKVTDSSDADWWIGELNGKKGSFPFNYVEKI